MLRIHFLQVWFNLPDPAVEDALYDSVETRSYGGINRADEASPDEKTPQRMSNSLERNKLGKVLLTAKGKQWYFGIKTHIGVDRQT